MDAYSQSIDEDMISVYYTIVVNLIICIFCVLFFSFFRRYAPENLKNRLYSPKVDIVPHKTPPRLRAESLFGWVYDIYRFFFSKLNIYFKRCVNDHSTVLSIDDEVIIEKGGYDVMSIIRFYRLCFKILLCTSAYCWVVLLPINGFVLLLFFPE